MTTIDDRHGIARPGGEDGIEAHLAAAFASEPDSAHVARMDARMERALRLGPASVEPRSTRNAVRFGLLAAALVILGGAGAVVLQRFDGWSAPDFDVAWERGTVLGLTDVADGYEFTLERAYADAGQVILAIAVEDLEQRVGTTMVTSLGGGTLVDSEGNEYVGMGGPSGPMNAHEAVELWYFDPPAFPLAPGPRHFTLTVDEIERRGDSIGGSIGGSTGVAAPTTDGSIEAGSPFIPVRGPWVIEFDLTVGGGTMIETDAVAEAGGAAVSIDTFLISPTRSRLEFKVEGEVAAGWEPVDVEARRGSDVFRYGGVIDLDAGRTVTFAYAGVDDPKGTWTITVGELVGPVIGGPAPTPVADGQVTDNSNRLRGPWVLSVEMP